MKIIRIKPSYTWNLYGIQRSHFMTEPRDQTFKPTSRRLLRHVSSEYISHRRRQSQSEAVLRHNIEMLVSDWRRKPDYDSSSNNYDERIIEELQLIIQEQQAELETWRGTMRPQVDVLCYNDSDYRALEKRYGELHAETSQLKRKVILGDCQVRELQSRVENSRVQLEEQAELISKLEKRKPEVIRIEKDVVSCSCSGIREQIQSLLQELKAEKSSSSQANKLSLVLASELTKLRESHGELRKTYERERFHRQRQVKVAEELETQLEECRIDRNQLEELQKTLLTQTQLIERQRQESMALEHQYRQLKQHAEVTRASDLKLLSEAREKI